MESVCSQRTKKPWKDAQGGGGKAERCSTKSSRPGGERTLTKAIILEHPEHYGTAECWSKVVSGGACVLFERLPSRIRARGPDVVEFGVIMHGNAASARLHALESVAARFLRINEAGRSPAAGDPVGASEARTWPPLHRGPR